MKKLISILLAVSMTVMLLAGCGGSEGSGGGQQNADAQAKEETKQAEAADQTPAAENPKTAQEEKTPEAAPAQTETANAEDQFELNDGYAIAVMDADTSQPVVGAMVQFCSDTQCMVGKTGDSGAAVFEEPPGNYQAHLLKVPEGYQKSDETLELTEDKRIAIFNIHKEGGEADSTDTAGSSVSKELPKNSEEWDFDISGFTFKLPEKYHSYTGQLHGADKGETDYYTNVYYSYLIYLPRTDEEQAAYNAKLAESNDSDLTPEIMAEVSEYLKFNIVYAIVIAAKNDISLENAISEACPDYPIQTTGELGTAGEYNYYYVIPDYSEYEEMFKEGMGDLYAELEDLMASAGEDLLKNAALKGAKRPVEVAKAGDKIYFETKDLEGNDVTSADLFAGHKVTMINMWGTWCYACMNELPELEELSKEFAEKGGQIIGVCEDARDDETVADAIKILENKGVTYTNIRGTEEILEMLPSVAWPTTYFVDSEGTVLTVPIKGANFAQYREKFDEALKAVE